MGGGADKRSDDAQPCAANPGAANSGAANSGDATPGGDVVDHGKRRNPPGRVTKGPFVDSCDARKYAWCRCEQSATYPYCDGTHRGGDVTPLKVIFDKPRTVIWCGCGKSGNAPYCDGTHSRL